MVVGMRACRLFLARHVGSRLHWEMQLAENRPLETGAIAPKWIDDDQPIMMSVKAGSVNASPQRCDEGRYKSLVPNQVVAGNDQNSLFEKQRPPAHGHATD